MEVHTREWCLRQPSCLGGHADWCGLTQSAWQTCYKTSKARQIGALAQVAQGLLKQSATMSQALRSLVVLTNLVICTACNLPPRGDAAPRERTVPASHIVAEAGGTEVRAAGVRPAEARPAVPQASAARATPRASSLQLKRLVVAPAVKDREPVSSSEPLPSDGTAIYAFAELANPGGGSENVRVTFERKGGAERVGDVTLPVPGDVSRHRTWAFTRFIRVPGVWEAVLWSESGSELGRTSFEVSAS